MASSFNIARERSLYSSEAERHLPLTKRKLSGLEEDMSSGVRINRPSDDPSGFARVRRLRAAQNENNQYLDSISTARGWVTSTEDNLNQMTDLFAQAYESSIQARNDTLGEGEREAIAKDLEAVKDQIVTLYNTRYNGEYLFAGAATLEKPFDEDGAPTSSLADISDGRLRTVGPSLQMKINIDGQDLDQVEPGLRATTSLDNLIGAVRGEDGVDMDQAIGDIEKSRQHMAQLGSKIGSTARRLDSMADQLRSVNSHLEAERSEIEDTDYLKTLSDFQRTQGSLEAALKVTSTVRQTTILDYLR